MKIWKAVNFTLDKLDDAQFGNFALLHSWAEDHNKGVETGMNIAWVFAPFPSVSKGRAAVEVVEHGDDAWRLAKLLRGADEAAPLVPDALKVGRNAEEGVHAYLGWKNGRIVYGGISNNPAVRQGQHGLDKFFVRSLNMSAPPVTRGQARCIEQALIKRYNMVDSPLYLNARNSISPTHSYYQQAVDYGNWWLSVNAPGLP